MADLIKNVNDDALTITITNNLDSLGVTTHLDDTIPNTNSVNGMYFKHIAKNIAVEETGLSDAGTTVVNSVSLQDVIDKLKSQYTTIVEASENAVKVANEVAEVATEKHGWYDEKIAELIADASNLNQNIRDVSNDLHAIVRIQRDEEGSAHADIKAKKFVVLDTSNNEKVAIIAQNDLLKVTNDTTNDFSEPSDILVNDVHLGNSQNSLNASLATFALQTNVDDLSTRVRVINSSVADLSTRANSHEEDINALRGRVTTAEQTISTYAVNVAERKL
jgi:predicted YcjX-like family ATPase